MSTEPFSWLTCRHIWDEIDTSRPFEDSARIDLWLKEIALSPALRKWFGHELKRVRTRYFRELEKHPGAVAQLKV